MNENTNGQGGMNASGSEDPQTIGGPTDQGDGASGTHVPADPPAGDPAASSETKDPGGD